MNLTASDTSTTQHTYTIDWTPDTIKWSIDGKVLRTLDRADTWNSTANRWFYPQTPARIMLSLWPAGIPSNGQGTIDWAGGMIDWNSPYMKNGYYYAMVNEVVVDCYDPPPGAHIKGSKSYIYTDPAATNDTVEETDNIVILKSLQATGEDPNVGEVPSGVSSSVAPTNTPASVPGQAGIGAAADGSNPSPGSDGATNTESAASASSSAASGGFNQGGGSTGKSEGDKIAVRLGGSVFAVLVAVAAALCW
jgi:beta-glucanase (GH16 family)